ncbi:MAG: hypothetical protein V1836_00325 [Candidatus Aenigmatarchaeota archaeon]
MMLAIILTATVSFLASFFVLPPFIRFLEASGIVGTDIHKSHKPKIAEMGGPAIMAGFLSGIFLFIWLNTFLLPKQAGILSISEIGRMFAGISTILIIMVIGMVDDISVLTRVKEGVKGFEKYKRTGLKQWQKPLLTLPAAIPLMAIMAGDSTMSIPLVGTINLGVFYPLLVVPLGVVGASNAMNMLAGFNGLEAGLSFVTLLSMGMFGYINGEMAAAAIAFVMAAAVLAFLAFNWYPAKIMPGDSFVYATGATLAVVAILGNMEKFAVYIFVPWIVELVLKMRSGFNAENYGLLNPDKTLRTQYGKSYSLTHIAMRYGRFKEWQISGAIIGLEIIVCIIAFFASAEVFL